jgi:hypothetical protein
MESCKYCGSSGEHAPDCPVAMAAAKEKKKFTIDEDLAQLRDMFERDGRHTPEQVENFIFQERQRLETQASQHAKLETRLRENPAPYEDEALVGAYEENIEPQVWNAVKEFRRKGYRTMGSGFGDYGMQIMYLSDNGFADFSPDVLALLEQRGVSVTRKGKELEFSAGHDDLDGLKKRWDEIADALPAKEGPAPAPTSYNDHSNSFLTNLEKYGVQKRPAPVEKP